MKPKPKPRSVDPNNVFAATTQIQYVIYDKQDYGLDQNTPKQPNNPSKRVLSDADAMILLEKTKASLNVGKQAFLRAIANGVNDTAARDVFRKASGYGDNEEFFNNIWKGLFTKTWNGIKFVDYLLQGVERALNDNNFLLSESKANRIWKININIDHSINVSFGYENQDDNPVIRYYKEVYRYRVLGSPNEWAVDNPRDILSENFVGWVKTDLTDKFVQDQKYGIISADGIHVRNYKPADPNYL